MIAVHILTAVLLSVVWFSPLQAETWPRYRGADGLGVSQTRGIPTKWTQNDYEWVTEIPGEGHSSPAIWEQSLFVTSGLEGGSLRMLLCLDSITGQIKWSQTVGFNKNPKHSKNSFASSSPATDGERVYVAFADQERFALAAYDFDGNLVWRNWLGPYQSQHGQGASPIVFEDLVIMPNDQDGPSSMVAYDRRDGRPIWSTLRAYREASYSTPLIIELKGKKPQLICLNGITGLTSLDPWSGLENWHTGELAQRTVASPTYSAGLIFATCGQGGKGTRLIGVDPSGQGDVDSTHVKLIREKELPYVPATIGSGDFLFLWTDNGVVCCVDPISKKQRWQERVGGNFSGSPICVDGKLYCMEESGKVIVVNAGTDFQLLGENPLGDPSFSTPAVANGRLYLRSFHRMSSLRSKLVE